jgi:FlaA1/EpsC-like NDP-sugar epimerase
MYGHGTVSINAENIMPVIKQWLYSDKDIFVRELVRNAYAGDRIIVGIVDDNPSLVGKYVGEVKVVGSRSDICDLVRSLAADSLVVACGLEEGELDRLSGELAPLGVKITVFGFGENPVSAPVEKV